MIRRIVIEIDADAETCGDCAFLVDGFEMGPVCSLPAVGFDGHDARRRHEACLHAECVANTGRDAMVLAAIRSGGASHG